MSSSQKHYRFIAVDLDQDVSEEEVNTLLTILNNWKGVASAIPFDDNNMNTALVCKGRREAAFWLKKLAETLEKEDFGQQKVKEM